MKKLFLLLLIPLNVFSCSDKNSYKISGCIKDMHDVPVALQLSELGKQKYPIPQWFTIDSTQVKNGKFIFTGELEYPQMMRLKFGNDMHYIKFFGDYGKIQINANKNSLLDANIEGSELNDQYRQYLSERDRYRGQVADLHTSLTKAFKAGDEEKVNDLKNKLRKLQERQRYYALNYAMERSNTVLAPYIIKHYLSGMKYKELDSLYKSLSSNVKKTKYARVLKEKKERLESSRVGAEYKNLILRDTLKNTKNLSEYIGKGYVLLEFWASWCGPCRKEIPNLKEAYKNYEEHNFEIIGISLDKNRKAWLEAIHQEDITWPQFLDKNASKPSAKIKYQINGIPFNVLINSEGTIVATNLRGNELDNKLDEIYSDK